MHLVPRPRPGGRMRRRPRVPGTSSSVWRRDIACGVDPARAFVGVLADLPVHAGQVWSIAVRHDDGCPSIERGGMPACTCEIVRLEARRAA